MSDEGKTLEGHVMSSFRVESEKYGFKEMFIHIYKLYLYKYSKKVLQSQYFITFLEKIRRQIKR